MATNEMALVHAPQTQLIDVAAVQNLGHLLAKSGYFSDAREAAQAAVKVMAGQELGIPPVAAMMGISIIKGKVALGGNLIASRIRAHGYDYRHKQFDNKGCVLEFLSKPDAKGTRAIMGDASFTEDDAKAAGVFSDMYKKYPRNMYFNRAISNGAKWYTPEVFAGAPVYVPEELGARVDENGDAVVEEQRGSDAAAQQVAQSKIVQMQQGTPYAETKVEPPAPQPQAAPQLVPDEVSVLWSKIGGIADVCRICGDLKAQLVQTLGPAVGDSEYYRIVKEYGNGAKHANELRTKSCKQVIWRLWDAVQQAKAMREGQGFHATDDDLPADLRQPGDGE